MANNKLYRVFQTHSQPFPWIYRPCCTIVQVFDRNRKFLRKFGKHGTQLDHQLKNPEGLSINANGDIIVADYGNKLIKIFSSSGDILRKFGVAGALDTPYHCIQHGLRLW